jgi:hypothetical protein
MRLHFGMSKCPFLRSDQPKSEGLHAHHNCWLVGSGSNLAFLHPASEEGATGGINRRPIAGAVVDVLGSGRRPQRRQSSAAATPPCRRGNSSMVRASGCAAPANDSSGSSRLKRHGRSRWVFPRESGSGSAFCTTDATCRSTRVTDRWTDSNGRSATPAVANSQRAEND